MAQPYGHMPNANNWIFSRYRAFILPQSTYCVSRSWVGLWLRGTERHWSLVHAFALIGSSQAHPWYLKMDSWSGWVEVFHGVDERWRCRTWHLGFVYPIHHRNCLAPSLCSKVFWGLNEWIQVRTTRHRERIPWNFTSKLHLGTLQQSLSTQMSSFVAAAQEQSTTTDPIDHPGIQVFVIAVVAFYAIATVLFGHFIQRTQRLNWIYQKLA